MGKLNKDSIDVCPNNNDYSKIKSTKVIQIAKSESLRFQIKVLLLVRSKDILKIFNITDEELKEFKENFFNIDFIIDSGKPFVIEYLNRTDQSKLLEYFLYGEEYSKYKLGLNNNIDHGKIYNILVADTLTRCLETEDIDLRLRCIKTINIKIKEETIIDKLSKRLEGLDL